MARQNSETEVKIRLNDPDKMLERLQKAGFVVTKPRVFEANTVYDTETESIRERGCLLRLREVGERTILTYKGPAERGKHKSREELETTLGNAETAKLILQRLSYVPKFRYEKYRTELERPGERGVVTLDDTPVGWFMELEGEPEWIDRTAGELGFSSNDYVLESYGFLYLQYCATKGIEPTYMVFRQKS